MGSVIERFPREATSIEIWWSRLVDGKEPLCPFAGTFVMIVGAFVYWAINTQRQLQNVIKLDHKLELSLGINSPVDEGFNYQISPYPQKLHTQGCNKRLGNGACVACLTTR